MEEIEAQKMACYIYAKLQGWTISKEFSEINDVYENKTDSLQVIHDVVLNGELDTLLVYEFNNLSKDDIEIPLAVSWFVENGIDIVSVKYEKRDFEKEKTLIINNSKKISKSVCRIQALF